MFALAGNISFKITTNAIAKAFIWAQNPAAGGNVTVDRIEFHTNIVHLKPKILDLVAQPSYQIYTESYSNFQFAALKTATTLIEQLVPFHFISLKTLFVATRLTTQISTASQCSTSKNAFDITDYTFCVGS